MSWCSVWTIVFSLLGFTNQNSPPSEVEIPNSTTACFIAVGTSFSGTKLLVLYSPEYEILVTKILKNFKTPVMINAVESVSTENYPEPNNLILIFGRFDIKRVLNESRWNSETRFFLLYSDEKQMEESFLSFWNSRVVNVFGVLNRRHKTFLYTYMPYSGGSCGRGKPFMLEECQEDSFLQNGFTFENSLKIQNLNSCPVNVTVAGTRPNVIFKGKCEIDTHSRIGGFEGRFLHEFSKKMSFTATYRCFTIGGGWIEPSPAGAVGSVFKGESEFAMGALGPSVERFRNVDLSRQYNMDECLSFGVPRGSGHKRNIFHFLVFEFDNWTWVLIMIFFVIFLTYFYVSIVYFKCWSPKLDICMELFAGLNGLPMKNPARLSERSSVICWVWFSFIMTAAYKCALGSKLTLPRKVSDIETIKGLLESNLEITGKMDMFRVLDHNDEKDQVDGEILKRFAVTNMSTEDAVNLMAEEKKIAYLVERGTFLYHSLSNPKAKGHLHTVNQCLILYHPSVVLRKNSFFTKRLNEMMSRLEESGIIESWRKEDVYPVKAPSKSFFPLKIEQFYGLFWLTGGCYAVATVCFLLEVYFGMKQHKNRNRID